MTLFSKLTSVLLVVLIAATASVLLLFSQGDALRQDVDRYPAGSTALQLFGVAEDRSTSVLSALGEFIEADGAAVVRVDRELSKADGGLTGMRIGIATNPHAPSPALDFSFLGTTFLDAPKLTRLLTSDPAKSIGLDANAADVISTLPELAFAPRLVVLQLARLVETSGTINGTYRVVGADEGRLAELLASLERATGQPAATLTSDLRGGSTDVGLAQLIVQWFLIAASLLLLFLLVFEAVRASRVLGVHLLLGRSRLAFTLRLFRPVLIAAASALPLAMVLTVLLAPGFELNASLLVASGSSAAAGAVIALLCAAVSATVLLSIKPVDAILRRYSKKLLLAVLAFFYVTSVAGFSLAFAALDGPLEEAGDLSEVSRVWADFADQRILYHESPGNDAASFSGQSSRHAQDFYSWYAAIADEPGVTLVNTAHYGDSVLEQWDGVYESVPTEPFWYLAASPSYLESQGFDLSADIVGRATKGERVFLLPDTWSTTATEAMKGWLDESSHFDYEASIPTAYTRHPVVAFEDYAPKTQLFLWNTDLTLPQRAADPVILPLTPENMIPFESESLPAIGLENSYVKLSDAAAAKFTSQPYLAEFGLDDNDPEYLPVSQFIAGLTKTIHEFLTLFGAMAFFLCVLCLIVLITLMKLYASTYQEALAVKRMLGYSVRSVFAPLIVAIGATNAAAVLAVVLARSTSGVIANLAMFALQALMLVALARRHSRLQLSAALKEQDQT